MDQQDFTDLSGKIWAAGSRREDLVQRVANALRERIISGQLAPGAKLVPESMLAKQLDISRPSLREAIRILAHEGLITVKHGVGTFVSKESRPMIGSLELMRSMTDMIRAGGGEPSIRDLSVTLVEPPAAFATELELKTGDKAGLITRTRLTDTTPFVVAHEYVVLDDERRTFATLKRFSGGSLYAFLRDDFGVSISHSKSVMTAVAADTHIAEELGLRRGAPLLLMHELHYGFDGKPVLLAVNHHNTEVVAFTSMRSAMRT